MVKYEKKGVTNGKRVVTTYEFKAEGIKFCKSILDRRQTCFLETNPHIINGPSFEINRDSIT